MKLAKLLLYFNTVKHLSLKQFTFNFIRRIFPKQKIVDIKNTECHQLKLVTPVVYKNKIDADSVCFLNQKRSFDYIADWTCLDEPKLWRYNLHYFDFLLDDGASEQVKDKLINDWISASHTLKVDAWEPYPVSLRIVNWVKYFVSYKNNSIPEEWVSSLYQQAHVLLHSIEYHILANHYLKNAKGLLFAGAYLKGSQPGKWFVKGQKMLVEEAAEQILDDGGHYEKSPMYHSILVEDCLDVINLLKSNSLNISGDDFKFLNQQTEKTLDFLNEILMPDGNIPLFNDSAFEIAPHPDLIFEYAHRITGYNKKTDSLEQKIVSLESSGYYIIKNSKSMCVIDCGAVSPDYQPGHTHCDLLSYELTIDGLRVIVNSGLHDYENSDERKYCRSTRAHNTLEIDGKEQSEVWGQFRVARRAEVLTSDLIKADDGAAVFNGSYSPFWASKEKIVHSREVKQQDDRWIVTDDVMGGGEHVVKSFIHLHPQINCKIEGNEYFLFNAQNKIAKITFSDNVDVSIIDGYYYPEFGKKTKNIVIEVLYIGKLPVKQQYIVTVV